MRVLEAFAGLGGLALGWHRAGAEHVAFIEREPFAQRILRRHWPGVPVHDDVLAFDARPYRGRVDVLSGGPPCQPVSAAGRRRGVQDERWLWGAFVDLAVALDAPVVVAENPPGIFSAQGGDAFAAVLHALGDAGYSVEWDVLAAGTVGAPHRRDRVFVVARRDGRWTWRAETVAPRLFPGRPGAWSWAGRWERGRLSVCGRQWPTPDPLPWETAADASALPTPDANMAKGASREGQRRGQLNEAIREWEGPGRLNPALPEWMMGFPADWSWPEGPSLTDAESRPWLPDLTAELALTHETEHRRPRLRALGNAVCVPVGEQIARSVLASAFSACAPARTGAG
jgi:DNA (cytosine-5)-methyltransferase 1